LRQEAGVLYPNFDKLADFDLSATRAETRRRHAALVKLGVQFARQEFDVTVSEEEFDRGLSAFIRDNAAPLLATVVEGHPLAALDKADSKETRFLVGSFVASLQDADPAGFEYLADVVKGALLASALYYTNITEFSTRLDRLHVYADTTLLLRAVGACGPDLQLFAAEVIALALKLGARVYCFRHTFDEVMGVLDACERAVRRGGSDAYGEATEYMLSAGWGQSDVIELKNGFERKLESIGVRVRDKPGHEMGLTLDESRLEAVLDGEIHYKNRNALLRDVDSLTAIFRLRRGNEYRNLERCRAIFVTHNVNLVAASRKYMGLEDWERDTIPLAVPDHLLTTLLWLKEPIAAPNLPDHAIIADCFAAMRPDDSLWRRYVEKIEDLRRRDTVTEDEYILLRQSMPVRSLIMYDTKQVPDAFTEGTVERVLAKARENIRRDALEQIQIERNLHTEKDVKLELARQEAQRLSRERDARSAGERAQAPIVVGAHCAAGLAWGRWDSCCLRLGRHDLDGAVAGRTRASGDGNCRGDGISSGSRGQRSITVWPCVRRKCQHDHEPPTSAP
jgi:hypothetical protein